jgi:hypothetical protein
LPAGLDTSLGREYLKGMTTNKYVGKRVNITSSGKDGVVTYADRAGLVVKCEDGSDWMGPKTGVTFI